MRIGLFPLHSVLFPGALLPLHIFEPRYRLLVRRCLDADAPFGVALIRSGEEVGGPADPFGVGTTARIVESSAYPDGRFDVVARGERRFAIEALFASDEPYLVAEARELPSEGDAPATLRASVRDAFDAYRMAVAALGDEPAEPASNEDAAALSYRVAEGLRVPPPERQRLLEATTARDRLDEELRLLARENARLGELIAKRRSRGEGPRLH